MGIYLNPDNKGFKETLAANIYVDKYKLNFIKIDVASEYQNARDKNNMLNKLTTFVKAEFPNHLYNSKNNSIFATIYNY